MSAILEKVKEMEAEMHRVGFWSPALSSVADESKLYAGVSFEQWLQFIFLPRVAAAAASDNFVNVPAYRVGLAALRQYDYHSTIPEAFPLMHLCQQLEKLLSGKLIDVQQGAPADAAKPRA